MAAPGKLARQELPAVLRAELAGPRLGRRGAGQSSLARVAAELRGRARRAEVASGVAQARCQRAPERSLFVSILRKLQLAARAREGRRSSEELSAKAVVAEEVVLEEVVVAEVARAR